MRSQRAIFTDKQTKQLELEFQSQQKPPFPQIKSLALTLGLTEYRVKIWFQNRRAKFKNESEARLDQQVLQVQPVQQLNVIAPQHQIVPSFVEQKIQPQAFPQQPFYSYEGYQPNTFQNQPIMRQCQVQSALDQQHYQPMISNVKYSGMSFSSSASAAVTSQMADKENSSIQPKLGDSSARRPLTDVTNRSRYN